MPKQVAEKEDWIKRGYALFAQEGEKGIVIEKIARQLKCNKSSFYWHFKTKQEFILQIVDYWMDKETQQIIDEVENSSTISEKLEKFLEVTFRHDPYLEFIFFLKRYAIKHENIQLIIDEIDQKRLNYTTSLFQSSMKCSVEEATIKASIFYKYLIGYHEMYRYKPQPKDYLTLVKKELQLLIN